MYCRSSFYFLFNKEERETDVIGFPKSMHRLRSQDGSEERQRSLRDAKIITVNIVDGPEKPLGHGERRTATMERDLISSQ
jgi:hypothetical protein